MDTSLIEAFDHLIEHKATSNNGKVRSVQPVGKDVGPEVEAVFHTVGPHKVRYLQAVAEKQDHRTDIP